MKTIITDDIEKVTRAITGEENFIAIGELHNSRSAIKFIMDNVNKLTDPSNDRKTYVLTEFFPTGLSLVPSEGNQRNYLKAKIKCGKAQEISKDLGQREEGRQGSDKDYTLGKLYEVLFPKIEYMISIESQPSLKEAEALYKKIQDGDIDAFKERVMLINQLAFDQAKKIFEKHPQTRVIIFAGIGHTASKLVKTTNGDKTVEIPGIDQLLRKASYKGLSICVHDPELCTDIKLLRNFTITCDCYTKYELNDNLVTVDSPDFLLFLQAPSRSRHNKKNK